MSWLSDGLMKYVQKQAEMSSKFERLHAVYRAKLVIGGTQHSVHGRFSDIWLKILG